MGNAMENVGRARVFVAKDKKQPSLDFKIKCLPFLLVGVGISLAHGEHGVQHQHTLSAPALQVAVLGCLDFHIRVLLEQ